MCLSLPTFRLLSPPPKGGGLLGFFLCGSCAIARHVKLGDDRVVNDPVDGRRHRALEELLPLAEHHVPRHDDRATLVALRDEREEDLPLLRSLFEITQVVEEQDIEAIQLTQRTRKIEISLGREKILNELIGRNEVNGPPLLA